MNEIKIEIRQKTNWKGVVYYYLYVNNEFINLSSDKDEIEKAFENAKIVRDSGDYIEKVIKSI
jgi:hypothetical protein